MSLEHFHIRFDNPLATYFCGEAVTGHLSVKLKKEKKMKAIEIRFFGAAEVRWTESYTRHQGKRRVRHTDIYSAREVYIDNTVCVLGSDDGDTTLPPGEYNFNFVLLLPSALPASFEGEIGHVRYTIKGKIIRPWRFNHECKVGFTVLNALDLNTLPNVQEPLIATVEKFLCCGCCRSGPVTIAASFPFTGFVPGQRCKALIEVDNQSTSEVTVKCYLRQKATYTAACGRTIKSREGTRTVDKETVGAVGKRGSKNFTTSMRILALPPSFLLFCNCIDISYTIEIEGEISGMHVNALMEVPIVIGTFPLRNQFGLLTLPEGATAAISPAPPGIDYPPLHPPSYEECVSGRGNIKNEDDDKHLEDVEFAPRYPSYRFE